MSPLYSSTPVQQDFCYWLYMCLIQRAFQVGRCIYICIWLLDSLYTAIKGQFQEVFLILFSRQQYSSDVSAYTSYRYRTGNFSAILIKKEKEIFLIYEDIQKGSGAKSYMRKGFLIYEEVHKYLVTYEEAVSHTWLCIRSLLKFLIYEENLIFFFISVSHNQLLDCCTLSAVSVQLKILLWRSFIYEEISKRVEC